MIKHKALKTATILSIAGLALAGCAQQQTISKDPQASSFGTIRIGTGLTPETELVAYLYAAALQKAGYATEIVESSNSRAENLTAMGAAESSTDATSTPQATVAVNDPETTDITPDFSGDLLLFLTKDGAYSVSYLEQQQAASAQPSSLAPSTSESLAPSSSPSPQETALNARSMNTESITSSISRLLPANIAILDASSSDSKTVLTTTRMTSTKLEANSIADVAGQCSNLALGGTGNFAVSAYGLSALKDYYRCIPKDYKPATDTASLENELENQSIDLAALPATSPAIVEQKLTVLNDPQNIFLPQNIVPLINTEELPQSAKDALNTVSARLTSSELTALMSLSSGENQIPKQNVANFWLSQTKE